MKIEVEEKSLSDLETNALALRKIAKIVLAGIADIRANPAKPRSPRRDLIKEREAEIVLRVLTNKKRRDAKAQNSNRD
jgi:hypothetical protein